MPRKIEEILLEVRIDELRIQHDHKVSPETSLGDIYRLLDERRHGAAMVCEGDRVVGIFTERDMLYRTALESLDLSTPIGELMTRDPVTLRTDQRLSEAIRTMVEGGYRHLPLVDAEGREAGLLSTRVVLGHIADHFPEAVLNLPPRLHQQMPQPEGG